MTFALFLWVKVWSGRLIYFLEADPRDGLQEAGADGNQGD
jgi:hypothetical protein